MRWSRSIRLRSSPSASSSSAISCSVTARSAARAALGRGAGGGRLEQPSHLRQPGQVAGVDAGHEHAAAREDLDQPLVGERAQRLADRRAAELRPLHQVALVDGRARRELERHDHLPQPVVRLVGERGGGVGLGLVQQSHAREYISDMSEMRAVPLAHDDRGGDRDRDHRQREPGQRVQRLAAGGRVARVGQVLPSGPRFRYAMNSSASGHAERPGDERVPRARPGSA